MLAYPWVLLIGWTCPAQAQGQGSYGGIAGGFFGLALVVIVVVVAIGLLLIRSVFGNKAALGVLAVMAVGLGYLAIDANLKAAKRREAQKEITRAFVESCAETTRVIEQQARGDERIYIRLRGADRVPQFQESEVLPSKYKMGEGVEVVTDVPAGVTNAVVVDISYSQDLVAGSYPGYEWHRTKYDLTMRTVPEGKVLAHTTDIQVRNGFCLGDLEAFLRKVLNRPGVLHAPQGGYETALPLPDAYVRAKYSGSTRGVYLRSARARMPLEDAKEVLGLKGCRFKDSTMSPPLAHCGEPPHGPVEVQLYNVLGVHQLPDSWLFAYRVFKGVEPLTSMRIEQRASDWRLMRVWNVTVVPDASNTDGRERLAGFSVNGDEIAVAVYWGSHWDIKPQQSAHWFTQRSMLTVPLPGLVR